MALLPDVFVPEDAEDNPFDTIKETVWLPMQIIKSELKDTNNKDGKYFSFHFKVTEGQYMGKMFFANLNWVNKSEVAVKIGKSDMKKICAAVEHEGELEDTVDLHNIPMMVKVTYKPPTAQWPDKNELKDFRHIDYDPESEELDDGAPDY